MGHDNHSDIKPFGAMFAYSLGAALAFFSIFWSVRHPGTPERFALIALVFAAPQLFFPRLWQVLIMPKTVILLGFTIAAACAAGSFFPLHIAKLHIYGAPWFLTTFWYFNLACIASAFRFSRKKKRGAVLAVLHISFVFVSLGMAIDGIFAIEGAFKTTPKIGPGVMPPVTGYLAAGESSHILVRSREDPGLELPFTITLKSFEVTYYEDEKLTLSPAMNSGGLGSYRFNLLGVKAKDGILRWKMPYGGADDYIAILTASRGGKEWEVEIPTSGVKQLGNFRVELSFPDIDDCSKPTDKYIVTITLKGMPKRYTSIVDVQTGNSPARENERIEVNRPLSVLGWKIYQANWGKLIAVDEWEAIPGNIRKQAAFERYLKANDIGPTSFLTVTYKPGRWVVYFGYLLLFGSIIAFLSLAGGRTEQDA